MFDIGWSELLIIGVVALIAIGPKELPGALRALGHWMGKVRRMASEFQDQFRDAMREAEVADLKKQVDEMTEKARSYANLDPLEDVRKDYERFEADARTPETKSTPPDGHAAGESVAPAPPEAAPGMPPATAAAAEVPIAPAPVDAGANKDTPPPRSAGSAA